VDFIVDDSSLCVLFIVDQLFGCVDFIVSCSIQHRG
jgi:hypothetical protein